MRRLLASLLICSAAAWAATPEECHGYRRHGRTAEATACYQELAASGDPYLRAEGYWGLQDYHAANEQFRLAVAAEPENAYYRVRWGRLFLEHYQEADAAELFQEALEIQPNHPGALVGLAWVASKGFEAKAIEFAELALKHDPQLVEARELLAYLALEDVDEAKAEAEAKKALEISNEALDAMAVLATIDWLHDRPETPWIRRILEINPVYGEAYALAAHFFVLNRRYEEGIRFYRKALELNPKLWKARSELGVNLMRLGRDEEARRELERCYEAGWRDAATVNTLRLMDSYRNFVTFHTGRATLRLHKKEAELLRPYFEQEIHRALEKFDKKYALRLEEPVQVEVYPDHEDFAVRTMGMPGLGALGVTFGFVVAMDSPSGRPPGSFHWASTLWHELSHVYSLTKTGHRVPRWFTEGLAVHEETAESPEWGDRINPAIIAALKEKKLLPVARLDRGFIRPSYPDQVMVSYFQAGKICDYIEERWGWKKLLAMLDAFAARKTTPEVIEQVLGLSTEEFDKAFFEWLDARTGKFVAGYDKWKKDLKALAALAKMGDYDGVVSTGPAIRDAFPDYVGRGNAYEIIAAAHIQRGDKEAAAAELERYVRAGGRNPKVLKKLARLQEDLGRKRAAAETLERLNWIYPVNDEELHRWLGSLWLELGEPERAIREYRAVVALNPIDRAAAEYDLARAYKAAHRHQEAFEHVVSALEAAPGFRPAQQMLLELSEAGGAKIPEIKE